MQVAVRNVSFSYGRREALKNVSFSIGPGVTGLVGANGSGKTTLLKLILGIFPVQSGEVLIDHTPVPFKNRDIFSKIGYIPEVTALDEELTARDYLEFFDNVLTIVESQTIGHSEIMDMINLRNVDEKRISEFSRGMKQRICMAQALLTMRELLVLDEPMAHLDPLGRVQFKKLLRTYGSMGMTVLISSHVLSELDEICDNIIILDAGKLIESGGIAELRTKYKSNTDCWVIDVNNPEKLASLLVKHLSPLMTEIGESSIRIELQATAGTKRELFKLLSESSDIEVYRFSEKMPSIEEILTRSMRG